MCAASSDPPSSQSLPARLKSAYLELCILCSQLGPGQWRNLFMCCMADPATAQPLKSCLFCSSNRRGFLAESRAIPATCPSSARGPARSARPTCTCTTGTAATAWMGTATTASARPTSSSASPSGAQVSARTGTELSQRLRGEMEIWRGFKQSQSVAVV